MRGDLVLIRSFPGSCFNRISFGYPSTHSTEGGNLSDLGIFKNAKKIIAILDWGIKNHVNACKLTGNEQI